jgi:hypothetical protein
MALLKWKFIHGIDGWNTRSSSLAAFDGMGIINAWKLEILGT